MKVYLAGPLFTTAERDFNRRLAEALRHAGHAVWLPQDHEQRSRTPAEIFADDVEGLHWADGVVACMDGPDPDSGTCWECGYAYARGMPVVLFRTDFRAVGEHALAPYNLMMTESATAHLSLPLAGVEEVARAVAGVLVGLETAGEPGSAPPA
ncbi:MAG: nucleoside 2-deoxyribosyltransferase [Telmatospirillum sp.]|nr:nucleoside 2-deoxyribosyltransferase [Telmatospirillum sp.]